jgi:2-dehydro-3-deoxygalactonokinase
VVSDPAGPRQGTATGTEAATGLIALDWGTSSLRAFLMEGGRVVDQRQSPHGIQHLPVPGHEGFERAFADIAGDWCGRWPHWPVVASGMVGSAQGWREAPYVRCPAGLRALGDRCVSVRSALGPSIKIVPGVIFDEPDELPDVMRGEETQIAGALLMNPAWADRSCIVLPGTHSKWAHIEDGKIVRYATFMTGELFDVLRKHSILGRLMTQDGIEKNSTAHSAARTGAFELGLSTARAVPSGGLSHQLFATRTLGLAGRMAHPHLPEFLSGLLIGHELVAVLASMGGLHNTPLIMIGDPALCARYQTALAVMGKTADRVLDNSAPAGLWMVAQTAGWVGTPGALP